MPYDRTELLGHVEAYLDALVAKDPSRLDWADQVLFTEQNVQLAVGDGLWGTISGRRDYDLAFCDPDSGEAGWIGIVEEHGVPGIMALRLRIENGAISEVETVLSRRDDPGPFPVIGAVTQPHPIFFEDVPPAQRRPRARMLAIADGYFDTLQLNDGTLFTEFTDDCDRVENGLQTTNNPGAIPGYDIAALGCAEQFRKGQFVYDDRLRDRRFPLVDEEKGLVLAAAFIDHSGRVVDVTWTDGTKAKSVFFYPHSFVLLELFKIVDGKIARIEAVFTTVPYNMPSPWSR
ncbi:MAG: hypothetical protein J7485_01815 [Sphingobium sp.]|nr:hypothetical protein [Sphingobium sp.]